MRTRPLPLENCRESKSHIKNIKFRCKNINIGLDKFDLNGIFSPNY